MTALGPSFNSASAQTTPAIVTMRAGAVTMQVDPLGFRFGFSSHGKQIAAPHAESGLLLGSDPVRTTRLHACTETRCSMTVSSTNGAKAEVTIQLSEHDAEIEVMPAEKRSSLILRTSGVAPAYGLGDSAVLGEHYDTDLSGRIDDRVHAGPYPVRLVSNLVVFPRQGMAEVLNDPGLKILHLTRAENAQGLPAAPHGVTVHYFFGDPHELYAAFAAYRRQSGHPIDMPKYAMFGVGWEAFGALSWNTDQTTVRESVDRYLSLGFPLKWIVIGSGFWPEGAANAETTSFGLYDHKKYPAPKALNEHFHAEGLKVLYGLRITFITDGPFAKEGVDHGYFIKENGNPVVYRNGWPKSPCYLLDGQNPEALEWYLGLVKKWTDFGVDGFKEDFFGYQNYDLRDDKLEAVNHALMAKGVYVIERNGYLGSAGDLHRIEDFNYNQDQDRGPVDLLSLAYAGLPLGYPDIVGGTFGEKYFDLEVTPQMETYMMRNAVWASMHCSMSVGQPPWTFKNPQVGEVMLQATKNHERLHAYLYSQAVRFAHEGFPWTMTPLTLAYPQDAAVYGRENDRVRGYQWMIGDALMAVPLYGNDYATATTRDIYLPAGKWMDYDSGKLYDGGQTLKAFSLPVDKTPLFVGGTGVVVEIVENKLVLRVYPVTKESKTEFWDQDSTTHSTIELHVKDWQSPAPFDVTAGNAVEGRWVRHAYEFAFVPGHNYQVR